MNRFSRVRRFQRTSDPPCDSEYPAIESSGSGRASKPSPPPIASQSAFSTDPCRHSELGPRQEPLSWRPP